MSSIANIQNSDIQKYTVVKILDIFGIDIEPDTGRLYYPEDPEINLQINNKTLCILLGNNKLQKDHAMFNPLTREDHAQFLMQLAVYSRIFAGELSPDDAAEANYIINSTMLTQDDNGVMYDNPKTEIEITDSNYQICGKGLHDDAAIATVEAILNYLWRTDFIKESMYKELVVIVERAYDEYIRLQNLSTVARKQEVWAKGEVFQGAEEEDDLGDFYEGPDLSAEPLIEYTDDDLATEFSDEDFENADTETEEFIDSDFTDKEIVTIFGWDGFDVVEDEDPEEIPVYENASEYNEDESQPEVVISITQYEQKGAPEFQNTQPLLPAPVEPVYQYTSPAIPVQPIYYHNNDDDDLTRF